MKIELHPEAYEELEEAIYYYDLCGEALRLRFISEIDSILAQISKAPSRWRIIEEDVRRCLCKAFPYAVLYTIESDHVLLVAVMHFSREPGYWKHRIGNDW